MFELPPAQQKQEMKGAGRASSSLQAVVADRTSSLQQQWLIRSSSRIQRDVRFLPWKDARYRLTPGTKAHDRVSPRRTFPLSSRSCTLAKWCQAAHTPARPPPTEVTDPPHSDNHTHRYSRYTAWICPVHHNTFQDSRFVTSASKMSTSEAKPTTKKFGKGERTVPHHSEKASKFYPAYDEKQPRKVCEDHARIV